MKKNMSQRLYYYFGLAMAFLMISSLILPALAPSTTTQTVPTAEPTPTVPPPTFPPPVTDFSGITFMEDYLHQSGLFTASIPQGWESGIATNNTNDAKIIFSNPTLVTDIEVGIKNPPSPITTPQEVSAIFTTGILGTEWARFGNAQERGERRYVDNRVVIDFLIQRNSQNYLAQLTAWTDGTWIYVVKVVVPDNARDMLFWLTEEMTQHINPLTRFQGTPFGWSAYYDQQNQHIIRYPSTMRLVSGNLPGLPADFQSDDGVSMRVAVEPDIIADEDAARAWVQALRTGIEVVSVEPIERTGGTGFSVAYRFFTPDGDERNGLAVLLNGEDDQLHTAVAQVPTGGVDLNSDDGRNLYSQLTTALDTFSMLTGLRLPAPTPTATPTMLPTRQPTVTPQPELTLEMTPQPEITSDLDEDTTSEVTPEATP